MAFPSVAVAGGRRRLSAIENKFCWHPVPSCPLSLRLRWSITPVAS